MWSVDRTFFEGFGFEGKMELVRIQVEALFRKDYSWGDLILSLSHFCLCLECEIVHITRSQRDQIFSFYSGDTR